MSSAAILGRVAKALGVTIPKPPQKPDLGLENVGALVGLPPASVGLARRLFNVRDLGLVDAELQTAQQAVVENLRRIRGEAQRIRARLEQLHAPLVALDACAGHVAPATLVAPPPPMTAAALEAERARRETTQAGGVPISVGPSAQAVIQAAADTAAEAARKAAALGGVAPSEAARTQADLMARSRLAQYNAWRLDADSRAAFLRAQVQPWQARLAALTAAVSLEDRILALRASIATYEGQGALSPSQQAALTAQRQELPMREEQRAALAIPAAPTV